MPLVLSPITTTGILRHVWIDPSGVERDLTRDTSPRLHVISGLEGLGSPIFDISADKLPFGAGTFVRQLNTKERTLRIPIFVREASFNTLLSTTEDLHDWFATGGETSKTPGIYRVIRPDDTVRQVAAYYQEGLDKPSEQGPLFAKYDVTLYAPDPYPTEQSDTVNNYTVLQASSFSVINQGRLNAFPRWKLTGPWTGGITLTNTTTGEAMVVSLAVTAGHYLIIDTRPSDIRPSVPGLSIYDDLNANKIANVSATSKFWQLVTGLNNITVVFTGGTTGATTVQLTYLARNRSLYF